MLSLACAASYARAGVLATPLAADTEYPIRDARELIIAMGTPEPGAQKASKAILERADPAMIENLLRYGRNPRRRDASRRAVVLMGRKAIDPLFALLGDAELGNQAGGPLFEILGPGDEGLIPALLDCARKLPAVKNYCLQAVFKLSGRKAAPYVHALASGLTDSDAAVRQYCSASLARVGKSAAAAAAALRKAAKDPDAGVREQARKALRRIGA
ncbi:MAG: hypothetical protein HY923_05560 [Elusimicrobia bacterium]|nr:hypothetical protein [Elusimicrobiota bacterium]